jgi:hypothetical protein
MELRPLPQPPPARREIDPGTAITSYWAVGARYGHFLSPTSDDAVIYAAGESHPTFWGGTLLLTKRGSEWAPIWYKLLASDSYRYMCDKAQKQSIRTIEFRPVDHPVQILVSLASGSRELSGSERDTCGATWSLPVPEVRDYEVQFVLEGDRFISAPQSRQALRLFLLR